MAIKGSKARGLAGSRCKSPVKKTSTQMQREIDGELAENFSGFNKYRGLPPDDALGNPLYKYGAVHSGRLGSYWTTEVEVPVEELAVLRPVVQSMARLRSVASARNSGRSLPPVELGVFRDGSAWIVDGNHRLADAQRSRLSSVPVVFTFVGS